MYYRKLYLPVLFFIILCLGVYYSIPGFQPNKFDAVLKHYRKDPADSLKLRAARFLVDNLKYHYGIPNYLVDAKGLRVEGLDTSLFIEFDPVCRHLTQAGFHFIKEDAVSDWETISPDYLIENIDLAFDVWKKPWCNHLSFDDFCEWILPYRVMTEPLSNWRKHYYDKYSWITDSIPTINSTLDVCTYIMQLLQNKVIFGETYGIYTGFLDPFEMEKIRYGDCLSLAVYTVLVMRAIGVPVTIHQVMYWAKHNNGHAFVTLKAGQRDFYSFSISDGPPNPHSKFDSTGCLRLFRYNFAIRPDYTFQIQSIKEEVPGGLFHPFAIDASEYNLSVDSLIIPVNPFSVSGHQFVYLCTFTSGDWRPVFASEYKEGYCSFYPVVKSLLYSLGIYENGRIVPVSDPFVFQCRDTVCYKNVTKEYLSELVIPFDVKEDTRPTCTLQVYYYDDHKWIPIQGEAIMCRKTRDKTTNEIIWIPCTADQLRDKDNFYLTTLKNVPKNTVFWGGGVTRLYTVSPDGKFIRN